MIKIGDIKGIEIYSGQIMSRVIAKQDDLDVQRLRVIVPKAISSIGTINIEELPTECFKPNIFNTKDTRITQIGDIVIKLSTPYDSAIITEETAGCVVPSFCAIIRNYSSIKTEYLQAFLSSKLCKEQLKSQVVGMVMTILSVGKIKDIKIPIPSQERMVEIGEKYMEVQNRVTVLEQIIKLESKRNDIVFNTLENEND